MSNNVSDSGVKRIMTWMAGGLFGFMVLMIILARTLVY
jgi:hypothetical protein